RFTHQTTLRLATPRAISEVFALLGIRWEPRAVSTRDEILELPATSGLYIWVKAAVGEDPMTAGGLYAGIGQGFNGLRRRVLGEYEDASRTAYHGHGIAVQRTKATVVAGEVEWVSDAGPALAWLDRHADGLKEWNWKPNRWDDEWD